MHNLALTVLLTDQRRRQCPCGAVADRPFGLCRKCQDRNAWRRKTTRGRPARRTRSVAQFFAGMFTQFALVSNGMEG